MPTEKLERVYVNLNNPDHTVIEFELTDEDMKEKILDDYENSRLEFLRFVFEDGEWEREVVINKSGIAYLEFVCKDI